MGEIVIVMLFVAVLLLILFVIISEMVAWLKVGCFFNLFHGWELLRGKDKNLSGALSQDIATIFVAAASILVAVSTIVQAHFTRVHDRVSSFPKNYFSWISISTNFKDNAKKIRSYFYKVVGDTCIEFNIKEGFSSSYKANPYRMFIFLVDNNREEVEWEEIKINQSKCINLHDLDANSYEMLIDCDSGELLKRYCELPSSNKRYDLRIFLDIEWINQLIPKWWRWFANIYIREEILLGDLFNKRQTRSTNGKSIDNIGLFDSRYQILYTDHYRAPLKAHIKRYK